jgi:DNA repair protein SbcC/Rad50
MKILELRFKNLNSLYGEWIIDFNSPDYNQNGIFALTGPTGAGKSTILDAICLALYGMTPRLGKITQSRNDIMSRETGECYAEVLFESQHGKFRCHWEQRRAKKAYDAKLQDYEYQIIDANSGQAIETKKSLVPKVVEEKTGMDYDRFTRSMLLAQGKFDTFLRADIEEKSKILEQITGTELYSRISSSVHERWRCEKDKLNTLKEKISVLGLLDEQQEELLLQELLIKSEQVKKLGQDLEKCVKLHSWLTSIRDLKQEIALLNEQSNGIQLENEMQKLPLIIPVTTQS